jgi:hypothetical protein
MVTLNDTILVAYTCFSNDRWLDPSSSSFLDWRVGGTVRPVEWAPVHQNLDPFQMKAERIERQFFFQSRLADKSPEIVQQLPRKTVDKKVDQNKDFRPEVVGDFLSEKIPSKTLN